MAEDAAAATMEVVEAVAVAPAAVEVVGPNEALRRVLAKSLVVDGVRRGLHESLKALAKGTRDSAGNVPEGGARVAILAKSQVEGDGKQLQKLVKALAVEKGCPLFEIEQASELGEWCGLCKIDKEGKARKIVPTSCAVITDYGEESAELKILLEFLNASK